MARMGMDVDAVEQIGKALQSQANALGDLIRQMDGSVNHLPSIWEGKDANDFVQVWWPQHRKALQAAQQQVHGLGQSALNNASEQRNVSGH